jgi:hypothetical protein
MGIGNTRMMIILMEHEARVASLPLFFAQDFLS